MAAHSRLPPCRDGAHKGHILAGIDEVGILPDAEPRLVAAARLCGLDLAGGRGRAVERERSGHAEPLRRFHDRLAAEFERQLSERAVAGVRERLLNRLRAVPARAYDRPAGEIKILIAGERLFGEIGEVFRRGDERHELEDRARRERAECTAVDEKTVNAHVGLAVRIVGRGGDHR